MHIPIRHSEPEPVPAGPQFASGHMDPGRAMPRIVHVDDDPDIRDAVRRILKSNRYEVDSYQTMRDFLESLKDQRNFPSLAILDVMVETMDAGLEAFVEIRRRLPRLHMIFMTSLGEEIRPYFTGLSDEWILIVEKPVEPVSLLSIIRSRLENTDSPGI